MCRTALDLGSYQVRVRAIEEVTRAEVGDWSDFQNFQIGTSPVLTAPVPANGETVAIVTIANPTITWDPVPGATSYEVVIHDITDDIPSFQTLTGLLTTTVTVASRPRSGRVHHSGSRHHRGCVRWRIQRGGDVLCQTADGHHSAD